MFSHKFAVNRLVNMCGISVVSLVDGFSAGGLGPMRARPVLLYTSTSFLTDATFIPNVRIK